MNVANGYIRSKLWSQNVGFGYITRGICRTWLGLRGGVDDLFYSISDNLSLVYSWVRSWFEFESIEEILEGGICGECVVEFWGENGVHGRVVWWLMSLVVIIQNFE